MELDTSNEKPNKDWKMRLDNAGELSAEILTDKNTAWEKLHARLNEKPRHRKTIWYWLAAASLLSAVFISIKFASKRENNFVKNSIIKEATFKPVYKEKKDVNDAVTPIVPGMIAAKKKIKITSTRDVRKISANTNTNETLLSLNSINKVQPDVINSVSLITNNPGVTFATSSKKKLKVIHINELGDPVEESPDVAHNADTHAFKLKIARQEVYVNHTGTSSNAQGFNFLKTKSSPN